MKAEKSDVYLIITQIFLVGMFIVDSVFRSTFLLILALVCFTQYLHMANYEMKQKQRELRALKLHYQRLVNERQRLRILKIINDNTKKTKSQRKKK